MGLDFKFSKFILKEWIVNIKGKKRDKLLMYPRFLQVIINNKFLETEKEGETLDVKSLASNTLCLMKLNRKGKYMFEGKHPLVKFGIFAESSDESEFDRRYYCF